jgi:hypothetical protein
MDINANSAVGELIETGKTTATNAASAVASDVKGQLGISDKPNPQAKILEKAQTDEAVKRFYEPSEYISGMILGQNPQLSDEDKIAKARQELSLLKQQHKETYFDPLIHPPKPPEPPKAEEIEQEKQQKMADLQQAKAKESAEQAVLRQQKTAVETRPGAG